MKTKTRVIRVFSFILALTLVFASFTSPAYAITPQQFNAWVAAALTAANVYIQSVGIPIADALDNLSNPPAWVDVDPQYTYSYTDDVIDEYMDRSVIKIRPDQVIIDDVTYQDVWLSHDAAEAFRVNSYDAITAWNIASESNGTFVSGAGYIYDIPYYIRDNVKQTQIYTFNQGGNYQIGDIRFEIVETTSPRWYWKAYTNDGQYVYTGNQFNHISQGVQLKQNNQLHWGIVTADLTGQSYGFNGLNDIYDINQPFDFDWVSSIIPADQSINPDDGLMIRFLIRAQIILLNNLDKKIQNLLLMMVSK